MNEELLKVEVSPDARRAAVAAFADASLAAAGDPLNAALETAALFIEGALCEQLVEVLGQKAELSRLLGQHARAAGLFEAAAHIDAYLVHHLRPAQAEALEANS